MAYSDIVFTPGEKQNFIVEVPVGVLHAPVDILTEGKNSKGIPCLETPLITATSSPEIIVLDNGQLAKKVSDTLYIKI